MIGTGNMGRILIEAFLEGKVIAPSSMIITNRTIAKAMEIRQQFPELQVTEEIKDLGRHADLIFICVKPHDVLQVVRDLTPVLTEDKCLISITSPISAEQLEALVPCSVARVIPSITNRALSGVTLLTYGNNCERIWKTIINCLLNPISKPVEIENNVTRVASDIVSCGPAFFSYLTQRFIQAATHVTEIDKETATTLASEMLIGLGELLRKGYYTLPTLQDKVCVKGGITGEGINVLENELGNIFEHIFQATQIKFEDDLKNIEKQYTIDNSP
jgi:competence protein ComER